MFFPALGGMLYFQALFWYLLGYCKTDAGLELIFQHNILKFPNYIYVLSY
jgi:hypothetical protein